MNIYTIAIDPSGKEIEVTADTEKNAYRAAWDAMSADEQNAAASLDCVEVRAA